MKIYLNKTDTLMLKKRRSISFSIEYVIEKRKSTWEDENCTKIQCAQNKTRSFEELFYIIKTLHPSLTWKKYGLLIRAFLESEKGKYFIIIFCPTIKKPVIYHGFAYPNPDDKTLIHGILYNYAYYVVKNFYKKIDTTHSFYDILNLMGFSSTHIKQIVKKHNIKE